MNKTEVLEKYPGAMLIDETNTLLTNTETWWLKAYNDRCLIIFEKRPKSALEAYTEGHRRWALVVDFAARHQPIYEFHLADKVPEGALELEYEPWQLKTA